MELQARQLRGRLDPTRKGSPEAAPTGGGTCYLTAVDDLGNAVSLIQSVYFDFGSAVVAGETGVLLQNRGSFFALDPAHPNRLEPNKRTFHTLIPAMLLDGGRPSLVYGTMGGEGQPQTQTAARTTPFLATGFQVSCKSRMPYRNLKCTLGFDRSWKSGADSWIAGPL